MKNMPNITTLFLISGAIIATVSIVIYASHSALTNQGLVHYFARLGIEVDYTAIIIALGLIPVFWLVAFIIKTFSVK